MTETIEDAMVHHERRSLDDFKAYFDRCKELRAKLAAAQTPEEVSEIEAELEKEKRAFNSENHIETAVKTND